MPAADPSAEQKLRHEYGKLVSMLCAKTGLGALVDAEQAAQRRLSEAHADSPQQSPMRTAATDLDVADAYERLLDMVLACCHPALSRDQQLVILLKIPCGFDMNAIARGLSIDVGVVDGRLRGAREVMRERDIELSAPAGDALQARLSAVSQCLYAMHDLGISSIDSAPAIRRELCQEALRLGLFLTERLAGHAELHAVMALMCLRSGRSPDPGQDGVAQLLFEEHARDRVDKELVQRGLQHLDKSITGRTLTPHHLEASIAAKHSMAQSHATTDWAGVQELYLQLVALRPHPVVRLRLAIASSKVDGAAAGLAHLEALRKDPRLATSPLLHAAFAHLYLMLGALDDGRSHRDQALSLIGSEQQRALLSKHLRKLDRE